MATHYNLNYEEGRWDFLAEILCHLYRNEPQLHCKDNMLGEFDYGINGRNIIKSTDEFLIAMSEVVSEV